MGRRKKLINNTNIPQYKIEAIAHCIMPDILAFYENEEGQKELAEWKAQRERALKPQVIYDRVNALMSNPHLLEHYTVLTNGNTSLLRSALLYLSTKIVNPTSRREIQELRRRRLP